MPRLVERHNLTKHAMQTFVTGVFGLLPLALTIAVVAWVVRYLHDLVGPTSAFGRILRSFGMAVTACEITAYIFGLAGTALLIYGLGVVVENSIGRRLHASMDGVLQRIPLLGTVYDASKSLTSAFDRRKDTLQGMTPVLCYFGDDGAAATPALMPTSELIQLGGREYHVVIIPSAPVPFGGALVCVRSDWIKPADCSFDELIGIYMSMGLTAPACLGRGKGEEPTLDPARLDVS
jgi:uncharacterized membrane protein